MVSTWRTNALVVALTLASLAGRASGDPAPFGTVKYTGSHGPVSVNRPIRVCCSFLREGPDSPFEFGEGAGGTVTANGGPFGPLRDISCSEVLLFSLDLAYDSSVSSCSSRGLRVGEPFLLASTSQSGAFTFDDSSLLPGVVGTVTYTGSLGTEPQTLLRMRLFHDAALTEEAWALAGTGARVDAEAGRFNIVTLTTSSYYLQAFLDLNDSFELDPGEPFSSPIGPIFASPDPDNSRITFGDENLPAAPTATPTNTGTPGPTRTPRPCIGDCDHDGTVAINELIRGVGLALGTGMLDQCPQFDCHGDSHVSIDCLISGVNAALDGCAS